MFCRFIRIYLSLRMYNGMNVPSFVFTKRLVLPYLYKVICNIKSYTFSDTTVNIRRLTIKNVSLLLLFRFFLPRL